MLNIGVGRPIRNILADSKGAEYFMSSYKCLREIMDSFYLRNLYHYLVFDRKPLQ